MNRQEYDINYRPSMLQLVLETHETVLQLHEEMVILHEKLNLMKDVVIATCCGPRVDESDSVN